MRTVVSKQYVCSTLQVHRETVLDLKDLRHRKKVRNYTIYCVIFLLEKYDFSIKYSLGMFYIYRSYRSSTTTSMVVYKYIYIFFVGRLLPLSLIRSLADQKDDISYQNRVIQ